VNTTTTNSRELNYGSVQDEKIQKHEIGVSAEEQYLYNPSADGIRKTKEDWRVKK